LIVIACDLPVQPDDPDIAVRENFVEVKSHVRSTREKIGFDSTAGWCATRAYNIDPGSNQQQAPLPWK
jgi:hypothetical protein